MEAVRRNHEYKGPRARLSRARDVEAENRGIFAEIGDGALGDSADVLANQFRRAVGRGQCEVAHADGGINQVSCIGFRWLDRGVLLTEVAVARHALSNLARMNLGGCAADLAALSILLFRWRWGRRVRRAAEAG